jgi:hypothetical protein
VADSYRQARHDLYLDEGRRLYDQHESRLKLKLWTASNVADTLVMRALHSPDPPELEARATRVALSADCCGHWILL